MDLPYIFLYFHSPSRIKYLITYFVPLLCSYKSYSHCLLFSGYGWVFIFPPPKVTAFNLVEISLGHNFHEEKWKVIEVWGY